MNKTLWYQSMAASDIAGLLTPAQMRDYLEVKHPISAKKHRDPEDVLSENDAEL